MTDTSNIKRRGFASFSPERRREVSSLGGSSVPKDKRSFSTNKDLAISAGRLGGLVKRPAKEDDQ